jgi:hypothetical protein
MGRAQSLKGWSSSPTAPQSSSQDSSYVIYTRLQTCASSDATAKRNIKHGMPIMNLKHFTTKASLIICRKEVELMILHKELLQ